MSVWTLSALALLAASAPAPPTASATPAKTSFVYESAQGGFALTVPTGWEMKTEANEEFPTLHGPKDEPPSPYVVIKEVRGPKDLVELANATVREMQKDYIHQLASRDAFLTADKREGYKYVFTSVGEPRYRQALYFVAGSEGRIFVILATVADAGWKKYEPVLDGLASSFRLRAAEPPKVSSAPPAPPAPARPATRIPGK